MAVDPITVGPGTLTIGATLDLVSFSSKVTSCRVVPNVNTGDPINVLSGEQVAGDRDESFTLAGTFVQDFGITDSTTEWLFENRGSELPFVFVPNTARGRQVSGTLTVEAIEIGGDVKTKPTSDFEFTLSGPPVIGAIVP